MKTSLHKATDARNRAVARRHARVVCQRSSDSLNWHFPVATSVSIAGKALAVFVILHAAGAAFAVAQFIFFPEQAMDVVPDKIALSDFRYAMALFAVLPSTFIAWDVVILLGLGRGERRALVAGFISGGAAILGTAIHAAFAQWSTMAIDGSMVGSI